MKEHYTFVEFLAACEGDNFVIEDKWLAHYKRNVIYWITTESYHIGDCTKQPATCSLCYLQEALEDYKEFTFNREKYMRENYGEWWKSLG